MAPPPHLLPVSSDPADVVVTLASYYRPITSPAVWRRRGAVVEVEEAEETEEEEKDVTAATPLTSPSTSLTASVTVEDRLLKQLGWMDGQADRDGWIEGGEMERWRDAGREWNKDGW